MITRIKNVDKPQLPGNYELKRVIKPFTVDTPARFYVTEKSALYLVCKKDPVKTIPILPYSESYKILFLADKYLVVSKRELSDLELYSIYDLKPLDLMIQAVGNHNYYGKPTHILVVLMETLDCLSIKDSLLEKLNKYIQEGGRVDLSQVNSLEDISDIDIINSNDTLSILRECVKELLNEVIRNMAPYPSVITVNEYERVKEEYNSFKESEKYKELEQLKEHLESLLGYIDLMLQNKLIKRNIKNINEILKSFALEYSFDISSYNQKNNSNFMSL